MIIEEAKKEKEQIEAQITDLINDFVDKTGLALRGIYTINTLRQPDAIDNQMALQEVVVSVKLDMRL